LTIALKLSATAGRVLAEQQQQQLLAPALRGDLLLHNGVEPTLNENDRETAELN